MAVFLVQLMICLFFFVAFCMFRILLYVHVPAICQIKINLKFYLIFKKMYIRGIITMSQENIN